MSDQLQQLCAERKSTPSYADLEARIEELEQQLINCDDKLDDLAGCQSICSYCEHVGPVFHSKQECIADMEKHTAVCEKHPCRPLEQRIKELEMSLTGRDKAIELLNKGLESATDQLHELKQENRKLKAELAAGGQAWLRIVRGRF